MNSSKLFSQKAAVVALVACLTMADAAAGTPSKALVLTGTVAEIFQVNAPRPSTKDWAVTVRVEKVRMGKYDEPTFTFTMHSPARAHLQIGHRYVIEATWDGHDYVVSETEPIKEEPPTR